MEDTMKTKAKKKTNLQLIDVRLTLMDVCLSWFERTGTSPSRAQYKADIQEIRKRLNEIKELDYE